MAQPRLVCTCKSSWVSTLGGWLTFMGNHQEWDSEVLEKRLRACAIPAEDLGNSPLPGIPAPGALMVFSSLSRHLHSCAHTYTPDKHTTHTTHIHTAHTHNIHIQHTKTTQNTHTPHTHTHTYTHPTHLHTTHTYTHT